MERSPRYRHLVNPFEPVRIFSDDQVESMHQAALGMLERQGMRILSPRGRAALAAAGASVDETTHMVRLDPALVAQALATRAGRGRTSSPAIPSVPAASAAATWCLRRCPDRRA